MAPKPNAEAAELLEAEKADREENANVNEAIARTDNEVFTDALGDEPLEDDAGTELEEMGDGLEGEELEVEAAAPEGEPEGEQPPVEEGEAPPVEEPPAPQQPSIPPRVLREQRERARETEADLRAQLRDMQIRMDNLARQPAPAAPAQQPAQAPQAPPDMFAEPDKHREWLLNEAEKRAEAKLEVRFAEQQRLQQQNEMGRLNESLAATATGPRAYEFNVAHRDLTSLEHTPANAALVRRLVSQPDPGQAILDWWETTSNPDYIEYHRDQIRQAYGTPRPSRQQQNGRAPVGQPRHEVRLPRSLTEAVGGRSQHVSDPEMFDASEESVFAYGARRS